MCRFPIVSKLFEGTPRDFIKNNSYPGLMKKAKPGGAMERVNETKRLAKWASSINQK